MNIFFIMFLIVTFCITYMAYNSLEKGPFMTIIWALVIAIIGNFFGSNIELMGDNFPDIAAQISGQSIVIINSIITGGLVSCAFAEIRERKKKANQKMKADEK